MWANSWRASSRAIALVAACRDVQDVVVVVVAGPRALVGVLPHADGDWFLEVVGRLEDVPGAEQGAGGPLPVTRNSMILFARSLAAKTLTPVRAARGSPDTPPELSVRTRRIAGYGPCPAVPWSEQNTTLLNPLAV